MHRRARAVSGSLDSVQHHQEFKSGPFEMALDRSNGILYRANWGDGIWALNRTARRIDCLSQRSLCKVASSAGPFARVRVAGGRTYGGRGLRLVRRVGSLIERQLRQPLTLQVLGVGRFSVS